MIQTHLLTVEINLSSLPWQPLKAKSCLPKSPGVYFALTPENQPLYIGQSEELKTRWNGHKQLRHLKLIADVKLAYHLADKSELHNLEAELIKRYNPPLNTNKGRFRPTDEQKKKYFKEKFLRQEQFKKLSLLENLRYLLDTTSVIKQIAVELGKKVLSKHASESEIWLFSGFAELSVMSDCVIDFIKASFPSSRFLFKNQIKYEEIDYYREVSEIPTPPELAIAIADFVSEISNFQEYSPKISNLLFLDYDSFNCKALVC
ncbi:MAG: GIY-YIG nuclease family protein [Rivularia sp. (in: cyanobacteria)]